MKYTLFTTLFFWSSGARAILFANVLQIAEIVRGQIYLWP